MRASETPMAAAPARVPPFHLTNAPVFQRGGLNDASSKASTLAPQARTAANEPARTATSLVNASINYQFKIARNTCDLFIKGMNLTNAEAREHTSFLGPASASGSWPGRWHEDRVLSPQRP